MMALCRFYPCSNQGMIMLSMCASRTIHIYWSLSDYYYTEKTTYPPSGEPSASSCRGKLSLRCWAFSLLNDCVNGDEADLTVVQTQKKRKVSIICKIHRQYPWQLPCQLDGKVLDAISKDRWIESKEVGYNRLIHSKLQGLSQEISTCKYQFADRVHVSNYYY